MRAGRRARGDRDSAGAPVTARAPAHRPRDRPIPSRPESSTESASDMIWKRVTISTAAGALVSALVGFQGCGGDASATAAQGTPARAGDQAPASIEAERRTAIPRAVARVAPAVVTVQTEVIERISDPFFGVYGGRGYERSTPGLGSGFIIRADGVIVTNAHVVAG